MQITIQILYGTRSDVYCSMLSVSVYMMLLITSAALFLHILSTTIHVM